LIHALTELVPVEPAVVSKEADEFAVTLVLGTKSITFRSRPIKSGAL
jgi:hypothetical protein